MRVLLVKIHVRQVQAGCSTGLRVPGAVSLIVIRVGGRGGWEAAADGVRLV